MLAEKLFMDISWRNQLTVGIISISKYLSMASAD